MFPPHNNRFTFSRYAPPVARFSLCALALLMLLAFSPPGRAQVAALPRNWTATSFPASASDQLLCANYSDNDWYLTPSSGELRISKLTQMQPDLPKHFTLTKDMKGKAVVAKADNGWLVGFDEGGLWWTSENGSQTNQLTPESVYAIVSRGNDLLVLTGFSHRSIDQGTAYLYKPGADGGTLSKIADLGSAPLAALVESSGTVLIAAQTRVLALDPSNEVRVLLLNTDMGLLYPNSIVEDPSGDISIGMRFFVLQLTRESNGQYTPGWYVPDRCTKTEIKDDSRCVCTGKK